MMGQTRFICCTSKPPNAAVQRPRAAAGSATHRTMKWTRRRLAGPASPKLLDARTAQFSCTRTAKDVEHPFVSFMTRHFIELNVGSSHRERAAPCLREHGGILDCELVPQQVTIDYRQPFNYMEVSIETVAHTALRRLVSKVRRVDN